MMNGLKMRILRHDGRQRTIRDYVTRGTKDNIENADTPPAITDGPFV